MVLNANYHQKNKRHSLFSGAQKNHPAFSEEQNLCVCVFPHSQRKVRLIVWWDTGFACLVWRQKMDLQQERFPTILAHDAAKHVSSCFVPEVQIIERTFFPLRQQLTGISVQCCLYLQEAILFFSWNKWPSRAYKWRCRHEQCKCHCHEPNWHTWCAVSTSDRRTDFDAKQNREPYSHGKCSFALEIVALSCRTAGVAHQWQWAQCLFSDCFEFQRCSWGPTSTLWRLKLNPARLFSPMTEKRLLFLLKAGLFQDSDTVGLSRWRFNFRSLKKPHQCTSRWGFWSFLVRLEPCLTNVFVNHAKSWSSCVISYFWAQQVEIGSVLF